MGELGDRAHLEMDETVHSGQSGILAGGVDGIAVNVVPLQVAGNREIDFSAQFLTDFSPQGSRDQVFPGLGGKAAGKAGSDVRTDHGSLDQEGAGSAEGIHQHSPGAPGREGNESGGEIFRNRRLYLIFAVTALVQGLAGRVNGNGDLVLFQEDTDRIGSAGFREHGESVMPGHAGDHGFFHHGLNVGGRKKLRFHAGGLGDPEFCILREKFLPGKRAGALKQFFKGLRMEGADLQENALCYAQGEIGADNGFGVALKGYAAVIYLRDLITEVINFIFHYALQTEMAGSNQFISLHHVFPENYLLLFNASAR